MANRTVASIMKDAKLPLSEEDKRHLLEALKRTYDAIDKCTPAVTYSPENVEEYNLQVYGPKREENTRRYRKLVAKTEGFDAGPWTLQELLPICNSVASSPITPNVVNGAKFAISTLNEQLIKEKKECLSVQEIIRVSVQLTRALIYFITIKASDGNFYEAKVLLSPSGEQIGSRQQFSTVFIRTAQHYPVTDPEVLQLKMSEAEAEAEAEAGSSAGPSASGSGC